MSLGSGTPPPPPPRPKKRSRLTIEGDVIGLIGVILVQIRRRLQRAFNAIPELVDVVQKPLLFKLLQLANDSHFLGRFPAPKKGFRSPWATHSP